MKKSNLYRLLPAIALLAASACSTPEKLVTQPDEKVSQWPRGVSYEIFVQSFCDSDNDGIGDIKGMTSKLDYLDDLGIEAVWLMPMSPSPSYHKYDVTDYYGIHPDYGTMEDFKAFVDEAHSRGIKVVIDLVLNHSGKDHPWFKEAAANPESPYRDYYVWAHKDDPMTTGEGKTTGADSYNTRHWHSVEGDDYKYFGYFWGGMPDLNFDNQKLREETYKIGRYWLQEVGVDGFRLDAARHIFPDDREADNHDFWKEFKAEMQKAKPDVYLVGEVWAEADKVAPYTKGLPALFNFEMSWAILRALKNGNGDSLATIHAQVMDLYEKQNPDFIDATILSNHDQNRIMSEVGNDMQKAKMAAALLFTLPGSPYIYYGEEIGMRGKKPDEQIREPFIWNAPHQDSCRTTWLQPQYSTDQSIIPMAMQAEDGNSILSHYKNLIGLRNNSTALTFGDIDPVTFDNSSVSGFVRAHESEELLVLHNVSGNLATITIPEELQHFRKVKYQHNNSRANGRNVQLPPYSTLILSR